MDIVPALHNIDVNDNDREAVNICAVLPLILKSVTQMLDGDDVVPNWTDAEAEENRLVDSVTDRDPVGDIPASTKFVKAIRLS